MLARHPLTAFFVLAYLGSWVTWSPWWLSRSGLGLLPFELPFAAVAGINQLGLFAGPFAAALVMTGLTEGREGVRRFWRRIVQWRAHPGWYALALICIPFAAGIGYLVVPGVDGAFGGADASVLGLLAGTYLVYLLGGPFQEEPGWRGFALPRLQHRLHPMAAALVLGVLHCGWHAPLFLTDEWDTARQDAGQYLAYLLLIVSMSVVMSWLANGSRGSTLLAILGHNGINWALFGAETVTGAEAASTWPAAAGVAGLAIVAVVATRGRLGHRASPPAS
ncbi:CPBP family intramembrane metalloprotease [Leucobacter sp. CSA1]|uniref:CPBP family intramembrane metalloprotease n=1 Tax=Leucobacter chromiisoli TaxID=2796471 RepID=A0A934UTZ6_9MICO|nr:CPBP family intramembrane glutamic endopeptidase [Leucobacter chromiisoli]MBK0418954.1 CPBP family intramembrane metalloprotease [Leucobacter chromiisoli]